MGAVESSTVNSVNKLSNALENIEKKLNRIEDLHLHHQAQICYDNAMIIHGKKIICRSGIHVTVGPILGLITESTANILIELNIKTIVSFHVFSIDKYAEEGDYLFTETLTTEPSRPTVITIKKLTPNTTYAIYLGGIDATESMNSYCYFCTLPTDHLSQKYLFTYDSQLISPSSPPPYPPSDSSLWDSLHHHLHHTPPPSSLSTPSLSPPRLDSVHLMFHLGNLICLEGALSQHLPRILGEVLCNGSSAMEGNEIWRTLLLDFEERICELYRQAFNSNEKIKLLFRSIGHIILCGESECGGNILKKLFEQVTCQTNSEEEISQKNLQEKILATNTSLPTDEMDEFSEEEKKIYSKIKERIREELVNEREVRHELKEEEKEVLETLQSLILRILRRVQVSYCRQLWDRNYQSFREFDQLEETAFQQFLSRLQSLHKKKSLHTRLQSSFQLLKERQSSGPKHKALLQLSKEVTSLSQEISSLQADITLFHQQSSLRAEQFSTSHLQPATHLSLGNTKLLLLDSLWSESISRTGFAVFGPLRTKDIDVNMSEEFWQSLKSDLLMEVPPIKAFPASQEHSSTFENGGTTSAEEKNEENEPPPKSKFQNILLLSPTLLLPTIISQPSSLVPSIHFDYLPSSCLYVNTHLLSHKHRLLSLLSEWKESEQKRGCLLVSPLPNSLFYDSPYLTFFSEGYTHHSPTNDHDLQRERKTEISLRYVLLSSMRRRGFSPLPTFSSSQSLALITSSPILAATPPVTSSLDEPSLSLWRKLQHIASVTPLSSYHHTGYLILSTSSQHPYTTQINHAMEEINYQLSFHSSSLQSSHHSHITTLHHTHPSLVCGPLIGAVSHSSVKILCDFSLPPTHINSPPGISLYLLNPHSSCQHIAHQTILPHSSTVFSFASLSPNSLYLIYLDPLLATTNPINGPVGFFCTPLAPYTSTQLHRINPGLFQHEALTRRLKKQLSSLQHDLNPLTNAATAGTALETQPPSNKNIHQSLQQIFLEEYTGNILRTTINETAKKMVQKQLNSNKDDTTPPTQQQQLQQREVSSTSVTTSQSKPYRRISTLGTTASVTANASSLGPAAGQGLGGGAAGQEQSDRIRGCAQELTDLEKEEQLYYFDSLPRLLVVNDTALGSSPTPSAISREGVANPHKISPKITAAILDGSDVLGEVVELMSIPFSGVELCVHTGNAVDLTSCLGEVIEILQGIERTEMSSRESMKRYLLHNDSNALLIESQRLSLQNKFRYAERVLRNVYRQQWNQNTLRTQLYRHGSHINCFHDPLTSLLLTLHYTSLDHMRGDYSEFCLDLLLALLEKLSYEFHTPLFQQTPGSSSSSSSSSVHFLHCHTACLFHLHPQRSQDHPHLMAIDPTQLNQLSSLLSNTSLQTVCLVSSLSLLPSPSPASSLSLSPLSYTPSCSSQVLELLFQWVSSQDTPSRAYYRRQVILITPGKIGIHANIHCYSTGRLRPSSPSPAPSSEALSLTMPHSGQDSISPGAASLLPAHALLSYQSQAIFSQIYVGSTATAATTTNTTQFQHTISTDLPSILSPTGTLFVLKHTQSTTNTNCALVNLSSPIYWRQKLLQDPSVTQHLLHTSPEERLSEDPHNLTNEEKVLHLMYTQDPVYILEQKGVKHFRQYLDRKRGVQKRLPLEIQEIWRRMEALLQAYHLAAVSSSSPQQEQPLTRPPASPTLLSLLNSIEIICRRCDVLYQYCFTQYTQSLLPTYLQNHDKNKNSPFSGQGTPLELPLPPPQAHFTLPSSLHSLLTSIYLSLISLLPHKYRPLFPTPNPPLLAYLWEYFTTQLLPQTEFSMLLEDRQRTVTAHEVVTHLLPQQPKYFSSLCRLLMMCHGLYGTIREENSNN